MSGEQWPRVKALFEAAVERPADERAAFLAAATGDDSALRREVESLLRSDSGESVLAPSVSAGVRVGPYEIVAPIGAGAMGEVYRARDTKLNRSVALKVLPGRFALDPDRLARFTREAHLLASLSHPNIGAIYGLEESNGTQALVLELIEGPTLADRIARGPLPMDEALTIARQIADAVEAAHEKGIVHRDLKPANIKSSSSGIVKVLDFGLAKVWDGAPQADLSGSPKLTAAAFGERAVLGTPAYMSPEQARGESLDKRTDIWAFGCVLYEMLTGRAAFPGDTISDTFAAILEREPDPTILPPALPQPIRRLLRRCLEKDRTRRLSDMADARLDIDDALSGSENETPAASISRTRERVAWAVVLLVGVAVAAVLAWTMRATPIAQETTRTILSVAPTGEALGANPLEQRAGGARPTRTAVAFSPDGKMLVFSGAIWGGRPQLYARRMDQLNATPIPGTNGVGNPFLSGGGNPFFSPDGQWVGFGADGELRKVPLTGGPAVTLCKASALFGASWGDDGTIIFATQRNGGLWRVPASGGVPEPLTTPQPGEYSHRLPHLLPGGRAVIFTVLKGPNRWDDTQIVVRSLETGRQTVLVTGGTDGRYVSTGHVVYVRLGTLMAVPFDPVRLAVTGGATGVLDGVMQSAARNASYMENTLAGQFTVSGTGAFVYRMGGPATAADGRLAGGDRKGTSELLAAPPRPYYSPRLSPDSQRVAVQTLDPRVVWSVDLARGALSPVTVDGQSDQGVFVPAGNRIVFRSEAGGSGEGNLYWKLADGSGAVERLTTSARSQTPSSWSPDGTTLAFMEEGESQGFFQFDIRTLSIGDHRTRALIQTPANEMTPEFSPDGRWLAYVSNESGRHEVYVQPYPGPGERHLISTNGGVQPAWRADGRELFYVEGDFDGGVPTLMSVALSTSPAFRAGTPAKLFENNALRAAWGRNYDVAPDGQRFVLVLPPKVTPSVAPAQMILVQHWFEELKRLVPATATSGTSSGP